MTEMRKEKDRHRERSKTIKMKVKKEVSLDFQNLGYLKKVPKKVDCWLASDKLNTSRASVNKNQTLDISYDQSLFTDSPKKRHGPSKIGMGARYATSKKTKI